MIKFGVALENFTTPGRAISVKGIEEFAIRAESLGFESVWTWDHLLLGSKRVFPVLDSLSTVSYLAARTSKIGLGTVYILPLRRPLEAAKAISSISYISGGRLKLAVVEGWYDKEFYAAGVDFNRRGKITSEYLKVLKRLLYENDINYELMGQRYVHVSMEPKPPSNVPIYMGGYAEAALRRVAVLSDGWMSYYYNEDDFSRSLQIIRKVATESGRNPNNLENSDMVPIYIGNDGEEKVRRFTEEYTDLPSWSKCSVTSGIYGSPGEVEERIERYRKAGVDRLVLIPAFYEAEQLEMLGNLIKHYS